MGTVIRRNVCGLLIWTACSALAAPAAAQVVRGTVTDPAAGSPVAEALVIMVNAEGERVATVFTTDEGTFQLDVPGEGHYMVGVGRLGYQQALTPQFAVDDADVALDIRLPAAPVALDEVTVESNRNTPDAGRLRGLLPNERQAGTLIGRMSRAEIDQLGPQADMASVLRQMNVPGLRVRRVQMSIGGPSNGICVERGGNRSVLGKTASSVIDPPDNLPRSDPLGTAIGNSCDMAAVYYNGLYVSDPADLLAGLTGTDLEQVQAVAPLEALARFGPRAANGAILIWTRTGNR